MDCKEALEETRGNLESAIEYLRKKGLAQAAKRAHREAKEGVVAAYIHPGAKLGVLVEVNCETDFVAKTDAFQALVRDVAMQIAAANPAYVGREDVPPAVVEREREVYRAQLADQDRKSTRLNSSHITISYAVFCLKKKKKQSKTISHDTR